MEGDLERIARRARPGGLLRDSSAAGSWSTKKKVNSTSKNSQDGLPDIAVNGSGNAIAVWYNGGAIYLARLAAGSSNWSATRKIRVLLRSCLQVAIDSTGNAYAVWFR